jgi:protein SCO1/2
MRLPEMLSRIMLSMVAALGLTTLAPAAPQLIAGTFEPPRAAPDFELSGSDGKSLKLADHRGKIVLLGFGFTSCPDICPTTLAVLAQARKQLGERADDLQVIYITVDPQTDTAAQMKKYLANFDSSFLGGTGTEAQLNAVREAYGILAKKKAVGANYTYAHSSYVYLIDRSGRLRALMPYGHKSEDFAHDVRVLLAE